MTQEATVADLGEVSEIQEVLEKIEAEARVKEADAKEGEVLAEGVIESGGTQMPWRRRKQSSMVHSGGKPLPERVKVFDAQGKPSMVPTAALGYHLSKRPQGKRVFFATIPEGLPSEPEPIEQTCEICLKKGTRKRFYEDFDYEGHMEILHPREWRSILRKEDRESQTGMQTTDMASVLLSMGEPEKNALRELLSLPKKGGRPRKEE